ncbi:MAG: GNAT family N-acetyltransferase [Gammaproteobacteria bacterium]|nr:GNAT family N-acetyltransferase [Gammaproteobacteria bacterium]
MPTHFRGISLLDLPDSGPLTVKLVETPEELLAAQRLRYHVFFQEPGVKASPEVEASGIDRDRFDEACDHLIVVDTSAPASEQPKVVGNYRFLRASVARESGCGFFTGSDYELDRLQHFPGEAMELGRSCVHADYRKRGTMFLLWQGIADYVLQHEITYMFGRASFPGVHVEGRDHALSYLHHFRLAPADMRLRASESVYIDMNRLPKAQVDVRRAMSEMPPLLKGYLRLGCMVGDGAVADPSMDQLDICVIVEVSAITDRYFKHYLERGRLRERAA